MSSFSSNIISILAHFIPTGMKLPILSGPLKGYFWIAGAAAGEGKGLSVIFNFSEVFQLTTAMQNTTNNSICFDIGANVGFYSLLFSRYGKEVVSFEPLTRNIFYLYQIIAINKINNIRIVSCAVSESVDFCWFVEGNNCAEGKIDRSGKIPVFVISIDHFISKTNIIPDIMKIDVEGAELSVLFGARKCISENRPKLLISMHGEQLRSDCIAFVSEYNYDVVPLDNKDVGSAFEFLFLPQSQK
ncbi:MAG: FkbM family methyltransferase [Methanoregula sp.]|nr:FkbM family methyltransferase [Methanoregula sp.]